MPKYYILHNENAESDELELEDLHKIIIRDRSFQDGFGETYVTKHALSYDEPTDTIHLTSTLESLHLTIVSDVEPEHIARALRDAIFAPDIDVEEHELFAPYLEKNYTDLVQQAIAECDLLPTDSVFEPSFGQILQEGVPIAIVTSVKLMTNADVPFAELSIYPTTALDAIHDTEGLRTQVAIGSHYLTAEPTSFVKEGSNYIFAYANDYDKDQEKPDITFNNNDSSTEAFYEERMAYLSAFQRKALTAIDESEFDILDDLL